MSKLVINISDNEQFLGLVKLDKLDDEEEIIPRKITGGLCVSDLLKQVTKGKYSLGELEINLDFDANGQLVQVELYT